MSDVASTELPPPALLEELTRAEVALGHDLPEVLREAFLQIGDGGFGPGYGLLGVGRAGHQVRIAEFRLSLPDLYVFLRGNQRGWPERQVPILDWGCAIWGTVHLETELVSTYLGDLDTFHPAGESLEKWLGRWADGEDLWEHLLE